jgi:DNA-binding MarR family transcriptional regulator
MSAMVDGDGLDPEAIEAARSLTASISMLRRKMRSLRPYNELSHPEISTLVRIEARGPTTTSALARMEGITAQSVGATVSKLHERGLIQRRPDAKDGRLAVITITKAGSKLLDTRRDASVDIMAHVLSKGFTRAELKRLIAATPLIERLAHEL